MISSEVKTRSPSDNILILLVDDEPDFLELSKVYLEMENPSLNIDTCTFVENALKMLENKRYTVVVSDYQMPGMDGLEFLEALRNKGNNIPFIIFTGRGREEVAIKALNLGADRYIQKGGDPRSQFGILAQAIINEASRKRAEERLYESEKKFRAIVTQSQDGITLTNEAGEIIEWNDAQTQLTQIPVSEAIGQKIWDIQYNFAPDDIRTEGYYNQLKSTTLNCLETGEAPWLNRLTDYAIERPDGTNRYMQQLPFSIKTQRGHMLCSITRDITELKKIEFNLKQSKTITDNLDEALLLLDMDGLASFANPTYEKITGYNISELIGKSGIELVKKTVVPHEVDKILEKFGKAVKGEELPPMSTYLRHRNGKETPIEFTVSFVRDDKGNPIQIVAVIRDITERKQAEEKLRSFVDAATDPFLLFDSDLNIIDINETALKGLGLNRNDALGASILDITPDIKETDRYDNYMEVMKTGKPLVIKDFVPSSKFGEICVELKAFKVGDGLGLITRDITESKRAEERLQDSEKRFRELVENINDVLYEIDGNGIVKYVSSPIKSILEFLPSEIIGLPFIDIVHPEDKQRTLAGVRNIMSGRLKQNEYRILTKTGDFRWILTSSKPVFDHNNKVVGLRGVLSDITERKQKEEELRKSEARYRRLFEESPISLWEEEFSDAKQFIDDLKQSGIKDFRKYFDEHPEALIECASLINVIDVNQATLDLYGAKNKEELLGNLDKVFTEETYPAFKEELIALAENRNKITVEVINKTLQGRRIYVDLGLNISSEEAESRALISIMDITDRKTAEEREEFLTTLLRHDLINKIHVINGYLKLLEGTNLSENDKKIIKRASDASKECKQLLEKIWMLSEIDQKEELTEVNLDVHIQNVVTKNQEKAKENQITIEYEPIPFDVIGGPLLEELFHNLIENAIRHSKCSKIRISGYRDDKNIKVIVEDDGKGIEYEIMEKLYDNSFKGKRKGIGTYIIKRIAANYGGSVNIKDSKLGGAKFIITLKHA